MTTVSCKDTHNISFSFLCFCSVLLIFSSFSDVLGSCLWSLSWSDFSFLSLSLSRPGEIRIQFHSLISGFGIRSQSGSYNRASLCFYWWSGEHWTLKSMFRHWFSISLSLSRFLQGMSPNPLLTHHPSSIPQKDTKVHIFNNAFRVHISYALRMSNCRFWMVTPKYGRGAPCQCRGFHTYSLWSSSLKAMVGRVGSNKCRVQERNYIWICLLTRIPIYMRLTWYSMCSRCMLREIWIVIWQGGAWQDPTLVDYSIVLGCSHQSAWMFD